MTEIKLSDQLGAMAIIDELYQQQQVILEHLDQATLRAKVAQKVKEYYQAKGLPIDDETIKQGVKLWFDRRLTFNLPNTSWFQKLLGNCYIKRYYWASGVMAIVACAVLVLVAIANINESKLTSLSLSVAAQYQQQKQLAQQLTTIEQQYQQLSSETLFYANQPVEKLQATISKTLNDEQIQTLHQPITTIQVISLAQGQQLEQQLQQTNGLLHKQLASLAKLIAQWQLLINQDSQLNTLVENNDFKRAASQYQVLQQQAEYSKQSLAQGKPIDIAKLTALYRQALDADKLLQEVQTNISLLKALKVPANEMKIALSLQEAINLKIASLDFIVLNSYKAQLNYYVQLAKTPLTLKIVDRVGYKSGIERTYDSSGGKSWYLIVEATNAAGEVYPLWIKSNESGETKKVNMFGVRVTKQEFDKVRQDKVADGHIDNALVGNKTVGRLTFDYSRPVMDGTILEW